MSFGRLQYWGLNRGYAIALPTLGIPCIAGTAPFLSPDLTTAPHRKSGYTFALAAGAGGVAGPNDCGARATSTTFYVTAIPQTLGSTGNRAFASNVGSAIWQNTAGTAPPEPFVAAGSISPLGQ